jgi:hypothetical protein
MTDSKKPVGEAIVTAESGKISEIAAHYLELVGGATGTFYEFLQFIQEVGEYGGPATGGGSFWQQIVRQRPLLLDDGAGT